MHWIKQEVVFKEEAPFFDTDEPLATPSPANVSSQGGTPSPGELSTTEEEGETAQSTEETPFSCIVCKKVFSQRAHLQEHFTNHLSNENLMDIVSFATTAQATYKCPVCEKLFVSIRRFKRHLLLYKRLKCEFCHKVYPRQGPYQEHLNRHTKQRSFYCKICGKMSYSKVALRTHNRIHNKEKSLVQFSCPYCPEKFKRKLDLNQHSVSHTNENEFRCRVCDKDFLNIYSLKLHQLRHSGAELALHRDKAEIKSEKGDDKETFKCGFCGKNYKKEAYFVKHLKIHDRKKGEKA